MRTQIWSSGGGTQSTAIAALICQGKLPVPDLAIIIDTEREMETTWSYLDAWVGPALKSMGLNIHRVPKSDFTKIDLYRNNDLLIPAYTTQNGQISKLPTFCSNEWKQRVMRRWATAQGVKRADIWIGFTIDEIHRLKFRKSGKWDDKYPLIDLRMTRGDCIALVERMGWPEPPRSSCWKCPNKRAHEWQWMKENSPVDFQKAVDFQYEIQKKDPYVWLTEHAKPLEEIDFSQPEDLFSGSCDSGLCFI